jgi:hypothetical protein
MVGEALFGGAPARSSDFYVPPRNQNFAVVFFPLTIMLTL